jgi:hypothetical protein
VVKASEANSSINLEHAMRDLASKKAELIEFKNSSNFVD